ncbi:MAG: hypothetical protein ACM31C_12300 [Acidobacteriota bacterium]
MTKDALPTIDPAHLAAVTGGSTSDDQVTAMLQQLMTSIQDLARNHNQNGNSQLMEMLPFLLMLRNANQAPAPVAAPAPPAPSPGDGWIRVS